MGSIAAMHALIVTLITGNIGILVRWIAGAIVAAIVALFAHFGFELDGDTTLKVASFVTISVAGALGEIAAKINANGVKEIQTALRKVNDEVHKDGHAGEVTIDAAKQITAQVQNLLREKQRKA